MLAERTYSFQETTPRPRRDRPFISNQESKQLNYRCFSKPLSHVTIIHSLNNRDEKALLLLAGLIVMLAERTYSYQETNPRPRRDRPFISNQESKQLNYRCFSKPLSQVTIIHSLNNRDEKALAIASRAYRNVGGADLLLSRDEPAPDV
uniref:hypothetical protein n=1 Tax=Shewanella sp. UCD-KL21 TaxID=1917164 RepID=UPI001C377602